MSADTQSDTKNRRRASRQRDRLIRFLSQPLLLEEVGPPRAFSQILTVVSLLIGGSIVLAALTEVRETAAVQGQIIPAGSVNIVQHLEGGIVQEILVEDGQEVEREEVLIRLQAAAALPELEQMRAREAGLALKSERLRAFVLDRAAEFSAGAAYPELVKDQTDILEVQIQARDSQRRVIWSRIAQRKAELNTLAERKTALAQQAAIIEEQLKMRETLLKKGLVSRIVYLENQRSFAQARGELAAVLGQVLETRAALTEARNSLSELDAKLRNESLAEMGGVSAELAQVRETLSRLEDRVNRLEIKAPARGVVKGLSTRTIGAVIGPGEPLMEIVPLDDTLVAEVRISPIDVGHLRVGQSAEVKVTTYDIVRFGSIEGRLKHLSASTFEDENGEPFFKGIIELDQDFVGSNPNHNPVLPGMVVDAGINTGRKSLLQYILRPVYRGLTGSFHER